MTFYNEIIPNLFLGSIESSQNFDFIKNNNISVIVNCSKDIADSFSLNLLKPIEEAPVDVQEWLYENSYYIKYYRIPVDDNGKDQEVENFREYTIKLLSIIKNDFDKGKKILVHCLAGNQRSASFVCAFIMLYKNIKLIDCIKLLLEKKPNVFFFGNRINFINALENLEKEIITP
jgi:dual specificity MAP kinase phosphatase